MSEANLLSTGYCKINENNEMIANCTCVLITGTHNIIVDTMTAWDSDIILNGLNLYGVKPEDINYVISTHGHSDHIGNNNLFLNAKHIVGFSVSFENIYYLHPFDKGEELIINENVKVIPTPGHTLSCVTVLVTTRSKTTAIVGDLFESEDDIENPNIWLEAGSENPLEQKKNRLKVAELAHIIIPGHGPVFQVTKDMIESLRKQYHQQ